MKPRNFTRLCSVEGCFKPHFGRGACLLHYTRLPEVLKRQREHKKTPKGRATRQAYLNSDEGRAKKVIAASKQAAKKHGYLPILSPIEDVIAVIRTHKCGVCNQPEPITGKKFCVDHSHETGKVRGLLCHMHNTILQNLDEMKRVIKWAEGKS